MKARLVLARISAIVGSVLLLFPVVFMLVTSIPGSIMRGAFLMDFLLPAELGLLVLLGALLLLAGAILAKRQVRAVAVTLGLMVFTLVGGQLLAVVSGLAHGDREPGGPIFLTVIASIILYDIFTLLLGIIGVRLALSLFRKEG